MEGKGISVIVNFLMRAIVGIGLIFFINNYVLIDKSTLNVGLNVVSFLTSGSLGVPGVCLLYGILIYQNL